MLTISGILIIANTKARNVIKELKLETVIKLFRLFIVTISITVINCQQKII
jgi:hypothetical protein